jgi:hypothetical protein
MPDLSDTKKYRSRELILKNSILVLLLLFLISGMTRILHFFMEEGHC